MAGNAVTLTFAGDATSLERSFGSIGQSAGKMAGDIDKASGKMRSAGSSFDAAGEAAEGTTKHMRGTADMADGLGTVLEKMGVQNAGALGTVAGLGMGFADLADGIGTTMLPALKSFGAAVISGEIFTKAWAASQALFNAVMAANPVILIAAGVIALGAALVLAYQHSETFRNIVQGAFAGVKKIAEGVVNFFTGIPDTIMGMGTRLVEVLTWPYRTAFNAIAKLWNNTVGKLSFEMPDWVPGLGGKGFSMPNLPTFHQGGIVPGNPGNAVPIMAMAGETIIPAGKGGAGGVTVIVQGNVMDGRQLGDLVHAALLKKQSRSGNLGFEAA